jgi:hypothetical protein
MLLDPTMLHDVFSVVAEFMVRVFHSRMLLNRTSAGVEASTHIIQQSHSSRASSFPDSFHHEFRPTTGANCFHHEFRPNTAGKLVAALALSSHRSRTW